MDCNSYRFSIEWARIEPEDGKFSQDAIDHYMNVISDLKKSGIEPLVTLHHFTNPLWIEENGGWLNTSTIKFYERYVAHIVNSLGSQITYWITINEPNVYVIAKYLVGEWFLNKTSIKDSIKAFRNLYQAHKNAFKIIKKQQQQC